MRLVAGGLHSELPVLPYRHAKTGAQLAKHIGLGADKIDIFLTDLEKNNLVKKKDSKYEIVK